MTAYLEVAGFRAQSLMPSTHVTRLESDAPGFLSAQLESESRYIDSLLGKRYASPFAGPVFPHVLGRWLEMLVTPLAYLRLGVWPTDEQQTMILARAQQARDEIKEAANAETGLYELPLVDTANGNGVVYGGPRAYSEASPYVHMDVQRDAARFEDRGRRGSY